MLITTLVLIIVASVGAVTTIVATTIHIVNDVQTKQRSFHGVKGVFIAPNAACAGDLNRTYKLCALLEALYQHVTGKTTPAQMYSWTIGGKAVFVNVPTRTFVWCLKHYKIRFKCMHTGVSYNGVDVAVVQDLFMSRDTKRIANRNLDRIVKLLTLPDTTLRNLIDDESKVPKVVEMTTKTEQQEQQQEQQEPRKL